jgi:hypothetical protein
MPDIVVTGIGGGRISKLAEDFQDQGKPCHCMKDGSGGLFTGLRLPGIVILNGDHGGGFIGTPEP